MAILVTGGSKGIGRAIALRFARPGNAVFINFHADGDAAAEATREIEERGAAAHTIRADVSTAEGARELLARVELAPRGVRANVVSAGPLDTEAFRAALTNPEERLAAAARANPSGRGLRFGDVTALVEMLASPEAEMVQGQTVMVDGGLDLL